MLRPERDPPPGRTAGHWGTELLRHAFTVASVAPVERLGTCQLHATPPRDLDFWPGVASPHLVPARCRCQARPFRPPELGGGRQSPM